MVSTTFKNSKKIEAVCPGGHLRRFRFDSFKKGHRCAICSALGRKKNDPTKTPRTFASNFEKFGFTVISGSYKNKNSCFVLKCFVGHEFSTTYGNIVYNKSQCPYCSGNVCLREEECRDIFQALTGKKFYKSRPTWLVNPVTGRKLELDGFCTELKLAFEYDTPDHSYPVKVMNKDGSIMCQVTRDSIKDNLCKTHGVRLIRIPHTTVNLEKFISEKI